MAIAVRKTATSFRQGRRPPCLSLAAAMLPYWLDVPPNMDGAAPADGGPFYPAVPVVSSSTTAFCNALGGGEDSVATAGADDGGGFSFHFHPGLESDGSFCIMEEEEALPWTWSQQGHHGTPLDPPSRNIICL